MKLNFKFVQNVSKQTNLIPNGASKQKFRRLK